MPNYIKRGKRTHSRKARAFHATTYGKHTDPFAAYWDDVKARLASMGWSDRGIVRASGEFKISEAFENCESAESFAARVDRDASLGMVE